MNVWKDLLMWLLPMLVVLAAVVLVSYNFLKLEKVRVVERRNQENTASLLKIRLQAYERLLLFLERISPQNLILRHGGRGPSGGDLQRSLLENIREEYEHNLVQQLYISPDAWTLVEQARSWVINMVNESAGNLKESADAGELAVAILENEMKSNQTFLQRAKDKLKSEVQELF
jgi:hypothetical protein